MLGVMKLKIVDEVQELKDRIVAYRVALEYIGRGSDNAAAYARTVLKAIKRVDDDA